MEGHGIRMMAEVFGGMMNMIIGCLVLPLQKGVQMDMLIWIMMEDVFQKYLIQNGKYIFLNLLLPGLMLETKSKSDVALNQKVNGP